MAENEKSERIHPAVGVIGAVIASAGTVGSIVTSYPDTDTAASVGAGFALLSILAAACKEAGLSLDFAVTSLGLSCLSLVLTVHDVKELKNAVPLPEPIVSAIKEGKISKSEIKERFAPEIEKIEAELLAKSSELREKFTALCKDAKIKGVRIKIDGMNVDQCATLLANEP